MLSTVEVDWASTTLSPVNKCALADTCRVPQAHRSSIVQYMNGGGEGQDLEEPLAGNRAASGCLQADHSQPLCSKGRTLSAACPVGLQPHIPPSSITLAMPSHRNQVNAAPWSHGLMTSTPHPDGTFETADKSRSKCYRHARASS